MNVNLIGSGKSNQSANRRRRWIFVIFFFIGKISVKRTCGITVAWNDNFNEQDAVMLCNNIFLYCAMQWIANGSFSLFVRSLLNHRFALGLATIGVYHGGKRRKAMKQVFGKRKRTKFFLGQVLHSVPPASPSHPLITLLPVPFFL